MPIPTYNASFDTYSPDNLIVTGPVNTREVTILSGETIVRGEVLGKITASGKYLGSLSGAADGSEVPMSIASEAVDASGGDTVTIVYESGTFNESRITLGTAHTLASVREGLREKGIFLKAVTEDGKSN